MSVERRSGSTNEHRGVPSRCNMRLCLLALDVAVRRRQRLAEAQQLDLDEEIVALVPGVQAREPDVSRDREALQWIVRVTDEQTAVRDEGPENSCV